MREEKENGTVTLWDDEAGIGLRFKEGETLQRYTAAIMYIPEYGLETVVNQDKLLKVVDRLGKEAEKRYPKEFGFLQ